MMEVWKLIMSNGGMILYIYIYSIYIYRIYVGSLLGFFF